MSRAGWRAALRLAWRDARKAKARTAFAVAMLALPVLALTAGDLVWRSYQLSPAQELARNIGNADAQLSYLGGHVQQTPTGSVGTEVQQPPSSAQPNAQQILAKLPSGSRLIEQREYQQEAATRDGRTTVTVSGVDYTDPMLASLVRQIAGRQPRTTHEAAITSAFAKEAGLKLGGTLTTYDPLRTFRVVGIVSERYLPRESRVYVPVDALPVPKVTNGGQESGSRWWLAAVPGGIDWQQVLHLNTQGFEVISREVVQHPPAMKDVPACRVAPNPCRKHPVTATGAAGTTLIVGMILMEIVLLAGPAFAVSARRRRRDLGLVVAVGGDRDDVRRVVLGGGIVTGLIAGAVGIVGGFGLGLLIIVIAQRVTDAVPGPLDIRPLELIAPAIVSVVAGVAAAWLPARSAAKQDVSLTLRGLRGTTRSSRRVPIVGLALAVIGTLVAIFGAARLRDGRVALGGAVVAEVGLLLCIPILIGAIGRLAGWMPLATRIAARDTARTRSATAPAVAAIMAAVTGTIAAGVFTASLTEHERRGYMPGMPRGDVFVSFDTSGQAKQSNGVQAALRRTLPGSRTVAVQTFGGTNALVTVIPPRGVEVYEGAGRFGVVVDDGTHLDLLTDSKRNPAEIAALNAGHAVVFNRGLIHNGMVTIEVEQLGEGGTVQSGRHWDVPAVLGSGFQTAQAIVSPQVAAQFGQPIQLAGILAATRHMPKTGELDATRAALAELGLPGDFQVERGFQRSTQAGLLILVGAAAFLTIGAAAIATALATADSRPDLLTLGAIGASPRIRRRLSAARAGVISGIGVVLGVACGCIAPAGYFAAMSAHNARARIPNPQMPFVLPWPTVGLTLVGVPLLAIAVTYLFSRSRIASERTART